MRLSKAARKRASAPISISSGDEAGGEQVQPNSMTTHPWRTSQAARKRTRTRQEIAEERRKDLWRQYFDDSDDELEDDRCGSTTAGAGEAGNSGKRRRANTQGESTQPLEHRVELLEIQLGEAYRFIIHSGLDSSAPESIRRHLEKYTSAQKIASEIEADIRSRYDEIEPDTYTSRRTKTSDDLSEAMEGVLPDILKLSRLPGSDSLKLAFDLAVLLNERSWTDEASGYGERPSDVPADLLLERLAERRRHQEPQWAYGADLTEMVKDRKNAQEYGIGKDLYKYTITTMKQWLLEDGKGPIEDSESESEDDSA